MVPADWMPQKCKTIALPSRACVSLYAVLCVYLRKLFILLMDGFANGSRWTPGTLLLAVATAAAAAAAAT
jgi:hypothetical protein